MAIKVKELLSKPFIKLNQSHWWQESEKYRPALFFLGGFLLDLTTLGRIDDPSNLITFSLYTAISALGLITLEQELILPPEENRKKIKVKELWHIYKNEIFHFAQGALLSAFTLFFFKSSSFNTSFAFVGMTAILLIANELTVLKEAGPFIKSAVFSLNLFSFFLLYVPYFVGKVGILIYGLSALLFALSVYLFSLLLKRYRWRQEEIVSGWLTPAIGIFIMITFLRVLNIIPPVPLALQKAAIYHKVEKKYPEYLLSHQNPWWKFWREADEVFVAYPDDKVYFFTRVFAPGGFEDRIILHWQIYQDGSWLTSDKIPLPITGGRKEGYRGYSYKEKVRPGLWRVLVETSDGREIGRQNFEVTLEENPSQERSFHIEKDF